MKTDVTQVMVEEHKLILRMIGLVERNTTQMEAGRFRDWQFYLDAVDFIRNFLCLPYRVSRKRVILAI